MKLKVLAWLSLMVASLAVAAAACSSSAPARAQAPELIYQCGQEPCQNNQEFEVFDGHANPIFSVPEYGGPAVFGDCLRIFAPGQVYKAALTFCYASPAVYDRQDGAPTSCATGAEWIAPQGEWTCKAQRWVKTRNLTTP